METTATPTPRRRRNNNYPLKEAPTKTGTSKSKAEGGGLGCLPCAPLEFSNSPANWATSLMARLYSGCFTRLNPLLLPPPSLSPNSSSISTGLQFQNIDPRVGTTKTKSIRNLSETDPIRNLGSDQFRIIRIGGSADRFEHPCAGGGEEEQVELESNLSVADSDVEQEARLEDPYPLGNLIRVCGKGGGRREHYEAFAYDGNLFSLEDPVLITPEEPNQKPGMAIIKGIVETPNQKVIVTGQMIYRPEEAQRRICGCWKPRFRRDLFYSFHRKEFPAECVMHKFVVHFIPQNKQLPPRKQHPGFIVQNIYDTKLKRLYNITDDDFGERRRNEIDLLVQKTISRLGDLPDIEPGDDVSDQEKSQPPTRS